MHRISRSAPAALLLVALAAAMLCASSPASALIARGHEFSASIGETGTGDGQFNEPASVAVAEVGKDAGDIYVVDRGNNRIVQLGPDGEFIAAWGAGVTNGAKEYQVCKSGCQAGLPNKGKGVEKFTIGKGELHSPGQIAVDNSRDASDPSAGYVYVVADVVKEKSFVYKLGPDGEFIEKLTDKEESEEHGLPVGVAVDPHGIVYVAWRGEGSISRFTNAVKSRRIGEEEAFLPEPEPEMAPGLAVNSRGDLYMNYEPAQALLGKESSAWEESAFAEEFRGEHGERPCEILRPCYIAKFTTAEEGERPVELGEALIDEMPGETSTAVAIDPASDQVIIDHGTDVGAYTRDGSAIGRFGAGDLINGLGLAVNGLTGQVLVADAGANAIKVFGAQGASEPAINSIAAKRVTSGGAELLAHVNPAGGSTPHATFEYGTAPCSGGGCTAAPAAGALQEGFTDQVVTATLASLAPGTTYHYKVAIGTSLGSASREGEFTTAPIKLADGRGWEMVSSPLKSGAGLEGLTTEGGLIEAAEDGNSVTYISTSPTEQDPEGNRAPAFAQVLARRGGSEWSSKDITIPGAERPTGVTTGAGQEYQWFSPDLSSALVQPKGRYPQSEPKLSPDATEKTIYVRHNEPSCPPVPSSCFTPIVTSANDTAGNPFGGVAGSSGSGVKFVTATSDMNHVLLFSEAALTPDANGAAGQTYEWTAGLPASEQLKLVTVLPAAEGGGPATQPGLRFDRRGAISADGSKVFFMAGKHVYMRDTVAGTTTVVDAPEEPGLEVEFGVKEASFKGASPDGSLVYFSDPQRLTNNSGALGKPGHPDLYVRNTGTGALTDLSAATGAAGDVLGSATFSADGSSVAFVANGVLDSTPNANGETATQGNCPGIASSRIPGSTCNLYVAREVGGNWQPPQFLARLSAQDEPDWRPGREDLGGTTMRFSPSGRYLAFMSQRGLTGFDNRDTAAAAEGGRAEEVFLYDTQPPSSGTLRCVSCDPAGNRPEGLFDQAESSEGLGPLVDRSPGVWDERWLAGSIPGWTRVLGQLALYQSRYLDDSGRLYFNSPEALVPADQNGKEDVYQYEPAGVGSCSSAGGCVSLISSGTSEHESAFLDATPDGGNVFFLTAATLSPIDNDENLDVYDARECTEASPCLSPQVVVKESCESTEACKGPATTAPVYSPPVTSKAGTGNVAAGGQGVLPSKNSSPPAKPKAKPTRAQLLSKALKACHKLKKKPKRQACERAARKKYGSKAKKSGSKASHR